MRIKDIFKNKGSRGRLGDIIPEIEGYRVFRDLAITRRYPIPCVLLGKGAVFIFIETKETRSEDITMAQFAIRKSLLLSCGNVFCFIRTPKCDYIFSDNAVSKEEITTEKIIKTAGEFENTCVLSDTTRVNLEEHFRKFQKYTRSKIVIKDGIVYELHRTGLIPGLTSRDEYFPVAESDPVPFLLITSVGGILGAHKFVTGQFGAGLFYLLTCGGFGVFHLFDLICILTGTYYIRQVCYEQDGDTCKRMVGRVYLKRLKKSHIKYGIAGLFASALLSYAAYEKLFIPALIAVGRLFI